MNKSTKTIGLCRNLRTYTFGTTRVAKPAEAHLGLALKLHEEVGEVCRAPQDVSEYADVLQVLMDFAELNGIAWETVLRACEDKLRTSGRFINPALLWQSQLTCKVCGRVLSEAPEVNHGKFWRCSPCGLLYLDAEIKGD